MTLTTALGINAGINILATLNLVFWFTAWATGYNHHVASIGCFATVIMSFSNMGFKHWIKKKYYVQTENQNQR